MWAIKLRELDVAVDVACTLATPAHCAHRVWLRQLNDAHAVVAGIAHNECVA